MVVVAVTPEVVAQGTSTPEAPKSGAAAMTIEPRTPVAAPPTTSQLPFPVPLLASFKRSQRVRHEQFGLGTVLTIEGSGADAKLTVYFDRIGQRRFVARYAKLTKA